MPDPSSLIETLRSTSLILLALRKTIANSGHREAMQDIDAFLSIALAEAERSLARAENAPRAGTREAPPGNRGAHPEKRARQALPPAHQLRNRA
jgi:hypothetical protein